MSHVTVVKWCTGLEFRQTSVDANPRWIGGRDLRGGGKNDVPLGGQGDRRGGTLPGGLHAPRRRETEAEMVLPEASKRMRKPE